MEEQHLEPLHRDKGSNSDSHDSSDDDSSVEIISMIDEDENDDEKSFEWPNPPSLLSSSSSDDIEELNNTQEVVVFAASNTSASMVNIQEKSMKRKRRQWTIKEKFDAIALFDKNQSKRKSAKKKGCTTAQLRNWIENREDLLKMHKKKKVISFSFD
jgi:hypothetical protein